MTPLIDTLLSAALAAAGVAVLCWLIASEIRSDREFRRFMEAHHG